MDNMDNMQEIAGSNWISFRSVGDSASGVFREYFTKEARDQFGAQVVIVLEQDDGSSINIGLPASNSRYVNTVKMLKVGHKVRVTLVGFYDQERGVMTETAGKTRKGMSFAKQYKIEMSQEKVVDKVMESISDNPF